MELDAEILRNLFGSLHLEIAAQASVIKNQTAEIAALKAELAELKAKEPKR